MRLICPNCGAQYDVPVDVIPEGGRDVQCSSCGHTWFQRHPDQDKPQLTEPDAIAEDAPPLPPQDPPLPPQASPAPPPHEEAPEAEAPAEPPKRSIDPEMAALFREEREFEARKRAAETLESQPDLGLEDPDEDEHARRSRQARDRMARLRGHEPSDEASPRPTPRPAPQRPTPVPPPPEEPEPAGIPEAAAAAAAANSRRELLPDVDEINQTLRADAEPQRVIDAADRSQGPAEPEKSGFGKGFVMIVALGTVCACLYAFADPIKAQVPQAAPYVDGYVSTLDQGRAWLDAQVTALLQQLDGLSSEAAQPSTSDGS